MKIHCPACFGLNLVEAALARDREGLSPATVGEVDAVLDFCREVSPDFKLYYEATRRAILGDSTASLREDIVHTRPFRVAYAAGRKSIEDFRRVAGLHASPAIVGTVCTQ